MFGKNKIAKFAGNGSPYLLQVQEIFYSIQGEGPSAGTPAIFIRLSGCNLRCHFCDTDFESVDKATSPHNIYDQVSDLMVGHDRAPLIVITGGEPLRQNISVLLLMLLERGYSVEIETAGTVMPPDIVPILDQYCRTEQLRIICSPKTPKINDTVAAHCVNYKYIVEVGDWMLERGVPYASTQDPTDDRVPLYIPTTSYDHIWVQPMAVYKKAWSPLWGWVKSYDANLSLPDEVKIQANQEYAAKICLRWGYRLSIQLHKIVGLE